MQWSFYKQELSTMIQQRNGYLVLAAGSLLLCVLLMLLVFCLIGREKIVVVPPTLEKSVWVSSSQASPSYLSEMTTFFVYLRFNVTPSSAALQHETLLRYTDPRYYTVLKAKLLQEADQLREEQASMAFFPVSLDIDAPHARVLITGDIQLRVGEDTLPTRRVQYAVQYRLTGGRLFVTMFAEVSHA